MVQHARQVVPTNPGIGTEKIKSQQAVACHSTLAVTQEILWEWVDSIHAEAVPVGSEAVGHRSHQRIVFNVGAYSNLLVAPRFVDNVHHAPNAVL
jgi:hypothetical protein